MRRLFVILILSVCATACSSADRTLMVDPLIGSGGHGHVFVGACMPHGMVAVGPNNVSQGWDWCSGYHDSDTTVAGFAQNHLSGTGIADLGEIVVMPFTGEPKLEKGTGNGDGYAVRFYKAHETAVPGYYSVMLDAADIFAEVTATERTAFHRYTYFSEHKEVQTPPRRILFDLESAPKSLSRKGCLFSRIEVLDDGTVTGCRRSDEWARGEEVWFAARFSQPVEGYTLYSDNLPVNGNSAEGDNVKAVFDFGGSDKVELSVALSYTSADGALRNLAADAALRFDDVRRESHGKWNAELSRIEFKGIDPTTDSIFYTSLYHTAFAPQLFADVDGRYRRADGQMVVADGFVPYTIFSLWDTYRAVHPLYTIIDPRAGDYVNSLADITASSGRLPVWHLAGHETDCMVGVHSVPVMVDAALKGVDGVDAQEMLRLVSDFDKQPVPGLDYVAAGGYVPADKVNWSVSRALEYAIDDDAVARLARAFGDGAAAERYAARALGYRNYFDAESGFMRGKLADGSWRTPFDPSYSMHEEHDYVEGNAWQYTWLVPHDVEGLISLFGGDEAFAEHLDALFEADSSLNEGASADITGMIGQYAHGNEPSHHTIYLYAYAGRQWRTAELVRRVCREFYTTEPDGLIGNEDCGQMSAWYVFTALGFYPVHPTAGVYVFGSPLVESATIHTVSGRDFTVRTVNNSAENIYIQSVTLDGKPYDRSYVTHGDLLRGGELVFTMGPEPNTAFGAAPENRPVTAYDMIGTTDL